MELDPDSWGINRPDDVRRPEEDGGLVDARHGRPKLGIHLGVILVSAALGAALFSFIVVFGLVAGDLSALDALEAVKPLLYGGIGWALSGLTRKRPP